MNIKPNLAKDTYKNGAVREETNSGYSYFLIANLPDLNLVDGKTYTVSFVMKQSEKGCGKFNAGPLSHPPRVLMDRTEYEIKDRSSFKFTCDKSKQTSIAVYTDLVNRKAGVGATLKYVKIEEEGGELVYTPYINDLEPSKQAIFLAGGGIPRGVSTLDYQGVIYVS